MKRLAAVLFIAAILISSAAVAKTPSNGRENRERASHVQEKKPKGNIENGNRRNERARNNAYAKPRQRVQGAREAKPKRKISSISHRNRPSRHYTYAKPRPVVQHVRYGHHRGYRSPLFSFLFGHRCSHCCH
jgi:hypothetical protein